MAKKKAAKAVTENSAPENTAPQKKAPAAKVEKRPIDSYTHGDKRRVNNPPVGLVTPQNDSTDPPKKTYAFDPHLDPQLMWAGKAERTSFEVPSISLHVHERIDPKSIIAAARSVQWLVVSESFQPIAKTAVQRFGLAPQRRGRAVEARPASQFQVG